MVGCAAAAPPSCSFDTFNSTESRLAVAVVEAAAVVIGEGVEIMADTGADDTDDEAPPTPNVKPLAGLMTGPNEKPVEDMETCGAKEKAGAEFESAAPDTDEFGKNDAGCDTDDDRNDDEAAADTPKMNGDPAVAAAAAVVATAEVRAEVDALVPTLGPATPHAAHSLNVFELRTLQVSHFHDCVGSACEPGATLHCVPNQPLAPPAPPAPPLWLLLGLLLLASLSDFEPSSESVSEPYNQRIYQSTKSPIRK